MRYEGTIRDTFVVTGQSGEEFLCMCRWHEDTSQGHLYINGEKGLYLCHSCGAKGRLDDLNLPRIIVGTDDVRERVAKFRARGKQETRYYPETWLKQYEFEHEYWSQERGFPDHVIQRFSLGYDPFSNRCTIPLRDSRGRILGVTFRRLDDGKPKYLDPKGYPKGRHLFGAWQITDEKTVALVEGPADALQCWAARVPALGLMGARITRDQIKTLQRLNVRTVVLMLDNDAAGIRGTVAIYEALRGSGIRVKSGWYRDYWFGVKDPGDLSWARLRKMYHSGITMQEWASKVA